MTTYMFRAASRALTLIGVPSYEAMRAALSHVGTDANFRWIGAGPRVVRYADIPYFDTWVAWPFESDLPDAAVGEFAAQCYTALMSVTSTFFAGGFEAFNPRIHGTIDFWQSGAAQNTFSRDKPPELNDRFRTPENPYGPGELIRSAIPVPWYVYATAAVVGISALAYAGSAVYLAWPKRK